jgi:DNA processing protein
VSATPASTEPDAACRSCTRRSWLLGALCVALDHRARDRTRLIDLLGLEDLELIDALGGSRREELRRLHAKFTVGRAKRPSVCRHDSRYPAPLLGSTAPHMLDVAGAGPERLSSLADAPTVAILGSRSASDYGSAMARSLGRGLAVAGVTVAALAHGGIGAAAQEGVVEAGGGGIALCGDGLDVASPVGVQERHRRIARTGCVISELPPGIGGRRWGPIAAERIAVALATVVVVVEARASPGDLFAAGLARASGTSVAAVPGRVTSPLAAGPNELLGDGACLVRDGGDVLELLSRTGAQTPPAPTSQASGRALDPRLRNVLERVGAGEDTVETLSRDGEITRMLAALGELELIGVLVRGEGGRYLPREALRHKWLSS